MRLIIILHTVMLYFGSPDFTNFKILSASTVANSFTGIQHNHTVCAGFIVMEKEIWKTIPEFEGLYQISNHGRIKSLERQDTGEGYGKYYRPEKIKKPSIGTNGYYGISFFKAKKRYPKSVHRLVAELFVKNPDNKPCVNHLDGDKLNNYYKNLGWVSYSENMNHAFENNLIKNAVGGKSITSKKVKQLTITGELVKIHSSITEAANEVDITMGGIIGVCKKQKYRNTCKGFKWQYV